MYSLIAARLKEVPKNFIERIKNDSFVKELFEEFKVPFKEFDEIRWLIDPNIKPEKYAKYLNDEDSKDEHKILLGKWIFEENNFEDIMHIAIHEIVHALQKMMPYLARFNEVQSYFKAIEYEIENGKKKSEIAKIYIPIFVTILKDEKKARRFFNIIFDKIIEKKKEEKSGNK